MVRVRIRLLGTFRPFVDEVPLVIDSLRTRELFGYLLLHHDRPLDRETLAGVLWGDVPTPQARKRLRQALWHLQALLAVSACHPPILRVSDHAIVLTIGEALWLDTVELECAFTATKGVPPWDLDSALAAQMRGAVDLYEGELLEGWYHDWCLHPREWLQTLFLALLDKIMVHCELTSAYDVGIDYGMRALQHDPARELTHQRLMRLHYFNGDRTTALRQYDHCATVLDAELGVEPARATHDLYHQIRDNDDVPSPARGVVAEASPAELLGQVEQIQAALADLRRHLIRISPT